MSTYTTGELAKECDVSVRTVQYYDNKDLLKTLQTNQTMIEGIAKGIESSFQIRGILKINTI